MRAADALDGVTQHVFGMELHPVAVTLARFTYLIAIGRERLSSERNFIQVPVYLSDALQWRHKEWRAHVGGYIRDLARPEWLALPENNVDVIIGNPPWLAYRFMPPAMQKDFREMSEARRLWAGAKVATHQDLSGLFVVRVIDLYLRSGGRFGFVMPSAALDRKQFAGFRAGFYDDGRAEVRVEFSRPWDLRRLRPHFFPVGAAVVFGKRSARSVVIPSPPEVWSGCLPSANASWIEVAKGITRKTPKQETSTPGVESPYRSRFRQGATLVPRLLFLVEKKKAGSLGQVAGRAAVESTRSAYEKKPWKDLPSLEGVIETEFIRPILLGETVLPYRVLSPALAVVPRDPEGLLDSRTERLEHYPGLAEWWRRAEQHWDVHRSSDRLRLSERLNFHGELENQFPIQPQRIVYTASGMHLAAARVTDRRAVIEHALYWASVSSAAEGSYLCAILNSATATRLVRPLMSYGKDERHIDKYIWKLSIPMFDAKKEAHAELAALGQEAEKAIAGLSLDFERNFIALRRDIRQHLAGSDIGQQIEVRVEELLK